MNEKVLVVPAACLWGRVPYIKKGLITEGVDEVAGLVSRCGTFVERAAAENDSSLKQIIPYAVVRHERSFLLLRRTSAQGERRLHDKLSIGVGGHINPSEITPGGDVILCGLTREIEEEIEIAPGYQKRCVGLINDDTTEVGTVHLGVLFEIFSVSADVRVRETKKMEGEWVGLEQLKADYERMESWSQIVCDWYVGHSGLFS